MLVIESNPKLCIVSVYLPSRGNSVQEHFKEAIQEIEEIIHKFSTTHALCICGDFNSSISRNPPNPRDAILKMFIEDNNLYTYQDGQPTFFHPNGHVQAEIDYILTNYSANELLSHVTNEGIHHDVSDHVPLSTKINIRTQLRDPVISTQPKPRWEKRNKEAYQNTLISNFGTIKSAMFRNINEGISELRRVLVTAVQKKHSWI